jgi:hypothetical protein
MSFHSASSSFAPGEFALTPAGSLIIKVYRCVMAGFVVGDAGGWDIGWQALEKVAPPGDAGKLFGEFYGFVRALLTVATGPLTCRPASCDGLCGDEALALNMIACAQRSDTVGLLSTAAALLRVDELGDAIQATQSLAGALARRGLFVRAAPIMPPCHADLCPRRVLH